MRSPPTHRLPTHFGKAMTSSRHPQPQGQATSQPNHPHDHRTHHQIRLSESESDRRGNKENWIWVTKPVRAVEEKKL